MSRCREGSGEAQIPDPKAKGAGWLVLASVVAIVFGLSTILAGGAVLFGGGAAERAAGAYVGFVVWFNFLAGFAYVASGAGLWARRSWAAMLAYLIAGATLLTFAAFGAHVAVGAPHELRTTAAMALRTLVWLTISGAAWRWIQRPDARRS